MHERSTWTCVFTSFAGYARREIFDCSSAQLKIWWPTSLRRLYHHLRWSILHHASALRFEGECCCGKMTSRVDFTTGHGQLSSEGTISSIVHWYRHWDLPFARLVWFCWFSFRASDLLVIRALYISLGLGPHEPLHFFLSPFVYWLYLSPCEFL